MNKVQPGIITTAQLPFVELESNGTVKSWWSPPKNVNVGFGQEVLAGKFYGNVFANFIREKRDPSILGLIIRDMGTQTGVEVGFLAAVSGLLIGSAEDREELAL